MKTRRCIKGITPLERHVARWLNSETKDQDTTPDKLVSNLMQYGCQSGMVGHLIYYHDTIKFYKRHRKEIDAMLTDTIDSLGADGPLGVFGDKWEKEDPLARDTMNQNLLAWFGFEETARKLAEAAGIEI